MLRNKYYYVIVLLNRIHVNGNSIGLHPERQKLKPPSKIPSVSLRVKVYMSRCKTFRSQLFQSDFSLITLSLTLKMTTAQIVETSVNLTTVLLFGTHSPGRSYSTHLWPNSWLKLFSLTPLYGHLIITDSLLCPWENKTLIYIFSKFNPLNTDTPLIQTLTIPPSPKSPYSEGLTVLWNIKQLIAPR